MKFFFMMLLALVMTGCALAPKTAIRPRSLRGKHVIYIEQSDRIPKEVLLAGQRSYGLNAGVMSTLPVEMVKELISGLTNVVPEMSKTYSGERMNNALIGRRILLVGYETEEQLKALTDVINGVSGIVAAPEAGKASCQEDTQGM